MNFLSVVVYYMAKVSQVRFIEFLATNRFLDQVSQYCSLVSRFGPLQDPSFPSGFIVVWSQYKALRTTSPLLYLLGSSRYKSVLSKAEIC